MKIPSLSQIYLIREAEYTQTDFETLYDANGKLRAAFYKTMDWAVDEALANQLMVILDFHDDRSCAALRAQFDRLAHELDVVAAVHGVVAALIGITVAVGHVAVDALQPHFAHAAARRAAQGTGKTE